MLALILALALPPNFATWYTAKVCAAVPQYECAGWLQPDQARRCGDDDPLACVTLTHTSSQDPFIASFDGDGLVQLSVVGPKGPKKVWER